MAARRGTVAAVEVVQLGAGLGKGRNNKRGQRQAGEVDGGVFPARSQRVDGLQIS